MKEQKEMVLSMLSMRWRDMPQPLPGARSLMMPGTESRGSVRPAHIMHQSTVLFPTNFPQKRFTERLLPRGDERRWKETGSSSGSTGSSSGTRFHVSLYCKRGCQPRQVEVAGRQAADSSSFCAELSDAFFHHTFESFDYSYSALRGRTILLYDVMSTKYVVYIMQCLQDMFIYIYICIHWHFWYITDPQFGSAILRGNGRFEWHFTFESTGLGLKIRFHWSCLWLLGVPTLKCRGVRVK